MERRSEPRFKTCQFIPLTILGDEGFSLTAAAVEVSAHGMRVVLDRPIPVGAAIKLESDDTLMLGEVRYCAPEANGFIAGLRLDQVLRKLGQVEALNRALFGEERGPIETPARRLGLDRDHRTAQAEGLGHHLQQHSGTMNTP